MSLPQTQSQPKNGPTTPFSEPWLKSLRVALGWEGGRSVLMGRPQLPEWQKRYIEELMNGLRARLSSSSDRRDMAVEVAKLLAAFPSQSHSESPAALRVQAYFEALADAPVWAVAEARGRILRGEVILGHQFCPSPPELAGIVKMVLRPLRADLDDLRRILAASDPQEIAPQERERVAEGFRKLKLDLIGSVN